jgi:short subunit dehydrogenase-like uncharacterized protein
MILIYGANGYTGRLVVERAAAKGLRPVIAGRSEAALAALARETGFDRRTFPLDGDIGAHLGGVSTVLHLAGPFSATSAPMASACIAAGINYVDITGEIDVFEALAARDAEAKAAGVVLLPGAGFDVVPSDCLAAHVKRRLPDATALDLVIGGLSGISRGTARTMAESIDAGTRVREGGRIVALSETQRGTADFGGGLRPTIGVSWGDVATAWHSTGIPNIRVYFEANRELERAASMPPAIQRLLGTRLGQALARTLIKRMPPGPTPEMRAKGRAVIIANASNDAGRQASSQLETPEGYALTAMTALEIARRIDAGGVAPGFHTPSTAFGPDFVLGFKGVTRRDLPQR